MFGIEAITLGTLEVWACHKLVAFVTIISHVSVCILGVPCASEKLMSLLLTTGNVQRNLGLLNLSADRSWDSLTWRMLYNVVYASKTHCLLEIEETQAAGPSHIARTTQVWEIRRALPPESQYPYITYLAPNVPRPQNCSRYLESVWVSENQPFPCTRTAGWLNDTE